MTRAAVVDIGTNSTRLLIADVDDDGAVTELQRHSEVTRLGEGVDATGNLKPEAMERVFAVLERYRAAIDRHQVDVTTGVLTSAVRDAVNGSGFVAAVNERFALDARTISGDEEAQLTFVGATSEREAAPGAPLVVIDVGGGSTEFVVGTAGEVEFHVSTQAGVVRQTERFLHHDPPTSAELDALAAEVRALIEAEVPRAERARVRQAIAVAGTATSLASIDQALDPYDPAKVQDYVVTLATCRLLLARLAALTDAQRREVVGLHPDRAPTMVAGVVILIEALEAFGLDRFTASEHDILRGAALRAAGFP
jgi:exopolyphosphatase / guanosine-5'-triphosphate,3'-diphosphate pyrophosphatase